MRVNDSILYQNVSKRLLFLKNLIRSKWAAALFCFHEDRKRRLICYGTHETVLAIQHGLWSSSSSRWFNADKVANLIRLHVRKCFYNFYLNQSIDIVQYLFFI